MVSAGTLQGLFHKGGGGVMFLSRDQYYLKYILALFGLNLLERIRAEKQNETESCLFKIHSRDEDARTLEEKVSSLTER